MSETYCGKNCNECPSKMKGICPGCHEGPGKAEGGKCPLAQCCRSTGQSNCLDCYKKDFCAKRASIVEEETTKTEAPLESSVHSFKQSSNTYSYGTSNKSTYSYNSSAYSDPFYAKWIFYMFILFFPNLFVTLFENVNTALKSVMGFLSLLIAIFQVVILLVLGTREPMFKKSAVASICSAVINFIVDFIDQSSFIYFLLLIISIILSFYAIYAEFNGYSRILIQVDFELSETWRKNWFWLPLLLGAVVILVPLIVLIPVFGIFMLLLVCGGIIVVGILKLVWLYRTYHDFK